MSTPLPSSSQTFCPGVENAGVLDAVAFDPVTQEVVLTMLEARPWEESEVRLWQIQEKVNSYLSFVLDGEMIENYPDYAGKKVRIQLDCGALPTEAVIRFLDKLRVDLEKFQVGFLLRVRERITPPKPSCNCSCD